MIERFGPKKYQINIYLVDVATLLHDRENYC